jgi:hypothetical protein
MSGSTKFETTFRCPNCTQSGRLQWEEGPGGGRERGGTRIYLSVSDGFHREDGRMPSGEAFDLHTLRECHMRSLLLWVIGIPIPIIIILWLLTGHA